MLREYIRGKAMVAMHVLRTLLVYRVRSRQFLPVACGAMFRLNRTAREMGHGRERQAIYDLKNRFVRLLYEAGFCVDVTKHHQDYVCWRCDGSKIDPYGWDDEEPCHKCGGTGLYRRNVLYCFTFDVLWTRWIWHQPRGLVDWKVYLTDDQPHGYSSGADLEDAERYTLHQARQDATAVWAALRFCKAGVGFDDWRRAKFPSGLFPVRERRGVRRIARLVVSKARVRLGFEEEIPF